MIIEYCRNVLGINDACSEEFDNQKSLVISKMESGEVMGGTMRLGKYTITLNNDSKIKKIYNSDIIHERHRHRYGVNKCYTENLNTGGFNIVGISEGLAEVVELNNDLHPWYIGCQYHPEYQSSPFKPHPLFLSFIQYCTR